MLSTGDIRRGRRRGAPGSVLSRRGDVLVSQTQRSRMLSSAVQVLSEHGYGEMSVSRITSGAGVSRRTFYDLFEDREDCFLAAFDEAVLRARELMLAAWAIQRGWREQVRAALLELLLFLDREPGVRSLLVVDALKAGPRVQERRAQILHELSAALQLSGLSAKPSRDLPELTGEGVVGAVLGVIHTRLSSQRSGSMVELLNPLMSVVVLPYLGPASAQRELSRPAPKAPAAQRVLHGSSANTLAAAPMRITHRTLVVLAVIGEHPGASNRQIADLAGVTDQGQISKLLSRLEGLRLIQNTSEAQPSGEPNAWHLTSHGQQLQQATRKQTEPGLRRGVDREESR
jgi:AcrR family transcriptional regulator/DNA-binding MarR family transcriptional regulator